ncbi:ANTAR domain-containing protein [Actinosynnema sp. NPDC004786]
MGGRRGPVEDHVTEVLVRRLGGVTGALSELCEDLDREEDLAVVLDRVCEQVVRAIPDVGSVSVTLLSEEGPTTGAASGRDAVEMDLAQYRTGEGPCLQAARTRRLVRAAAAEVPDRWPAFGAAVAHRGVTSYLSAPLHVDDEQPGSLNLYRAGPGDFRPLDAALVELFSTAAGAAMRNARRHLHARDQAAQLGLALTSRAVIDQAKGIVMAVHRVSADEAFSMLVDRSQRENVKLRDYAERFIEEVLGGGA